MSARMSARVLGTATAALLVATITMSAPAGPARAQDGEAGAEKAEKAHPLGGPGLKVDVGYRRLFSDKTNSVYYNIVLLGETILQGGKALSDAGGFNEAPQFRNDEPSLRLAFERGNPTLDGPLASFLRVGELKRIAGLRAVIQGYGTLADTSSLGFAAGIEKPLPGLLPLPGLPNFLTFGLQAGTQPVTVGTGDEERTRQRDVGVMAYRQFAAYAPLNTYSDYRRAARAFADALPDPPPIINLSDFYKAIISGDVAVLDLLATTPKAQEALNTLSDDDKELLVRDLRFAAPFTVAQVTNAPDVVGRAIRERLRNPAPNSQLEAFRMQLDSAAMDINLQDWDADDKKAIEAAEHFIANRGLVAATLPTAADAKLYVVNNLRFTPQHEVVTGANKLIDLAYKQQKPDDRKTFLLITNRLLFESIFPEIAPYGVATQGFKARLKNLYLLKDRSSFVVLLENTGQYYFAGDDGNGTSSRLNHLFAATGTFYADPSGDRRTFVRLRFENGRNRAAPTIYLNQITTTVGLEF